MLPDPPVTFGIAFVAALQNSTFRSLGEWSYTSVVTTGNLRSAGEAIYAAVFSGKRPADHKAQASGAVCAAFAGGAAVDAILTAAFGRGMIAVPIAMLGLVLIRCRVRAAGPG